MTVAVHGVAESQTRLIDFQFCLGPTGATDFSQVFSRETYMVRVAFRQVNLQRKEKLKRARLNPGECCETPPGVGVQ